MQYSRKILKIILSVRSFVSREVEGTLLIMLNCANDSFPVNVFYSEISPRIDPPPTHVKKTNKIQENHRRRKKDQPKLTPDFSALSEKRISSWA
jgi:hypothetical protein